MKDKATFQNKVKVLNKLFDSGCDTEKKLQQLDMEGLALIRTVILNLMISEMLLTSIRRKHSMHLDLLPVILQKWD